MTDLKINLNSRRSRYEAAQSIAIDWAEVLDSITYQTVLSCAMSTGTPIDFFIMPMLSVAGSLMNQSEVLCHSKTNWKEPAILWTIVTSPAGIY